MVDDNILLTSLVPRHLNAGAYQEVRDIFNAANTVGNNKWYRIKERNDLLESYLEELENFLEQLLSLWSAPSPTAGLAAMITEILLIRSSLCSIAELYSPEFYQMLVERKVITPAQAYARASLVRSGGDRADILRQIRANLPGRLSGVNETQMLAAAVTVNDGDNRIIRLAAMAMNAPPSKVDEYIEEIAKEPNEGSKSGGFQRLLETGLQRYQIDRLIVLTEAFGDRHISIRCLVRLAPFLNKAAQEALAGKLVDKLLDESQDSQQADNLQSLFPLLSRTQFDGFVSRLPEEALYDPSLPLYPVLWEQMAVNNPDEAYWYLMGVKLDSADKGTYWRAAVRWVVTQFIKVGDYQRAMQLIRLHMSDADLTYLTESLQPYEGVLDKIWTYAQTLISDTKERRSFGLKLFEVWSGISDSDLFDVYRFLSPNGLPDEKSLPIAARLCLINDPNQSGYARQKVLQYLDDNIERNWAGGHFPALAAAADWLSDDVFTAYAERILQEPLPWYSRELPSLTRLARQFYQRNMPEMLPRLFRIIPNKEERIEYLVLLGDLLSNVQLSDFMLELNQIHDHGRAALTILQCRILAGHSDCANQFHQIEPPERHRGSLLVIKSLIPRAGDDCREAMLDWAFGHILMLEDQAELIRQLIELSPFIGPDFFKAHPNWQEYAEPYDIKNWLIRQNNFDQRVVCAEKLYQEIIAGEWEARGIGYTLLSLTNVVPDLDERLWGDLQTDAIFPDVRASLLAAWFPELHEDRQRILTEELLRNNRPLLDVDDDYRITCLSYILPFMKTAEREQYLLREMESDWWNVATIDIRIHALSAFKEYLADYPAPETIFKQHTSQLQWEVANQYREQDQGNEDSKEETLFNKIRMLPLLDDTQRSALRQEISYCLEAPVLDSDLEDFGALLQKVGEHDLITQLYYTIQQGDGFRRISSVIPYLPKNVLLNMLEAGEIDMRYLANAAAVAWNLHKNGEKFKAISVVLALGNIHPTMSSRSDWQEIKALFYELLPEITQPLLNQIGSFTEEGFRSDCYKWVYPHLSSIDRAQHVLPLLNLLLSKDPYFVHYDELFEFFTASTSLFPESLVRQILLNFFKFSANLSRPELLKALNAAIQLIAELEPEAPATIAEAIEINLNWWP